VGHAAPSVILKKSPVYLSRFLGGSAMLYQPPSVPALGFALLVQLKEIKKWILTNTPTHY
jgi:hypothetical protein